MNTVITYGTFDLFHVGHVRLLKRLRALGSRLVVGCSTDEFNLEKGKRSVFSYDDRSEILRSCQYVDEVFPESSWDQKINDIKKYSADVFAMGDDWAGKFDFLERDGHCSVIYLPRTEGISTTDLKSAIRILNREKVDGILHAVRNIEEQIRSLQLRYFNSPFIFVGLFESLIDPEVRFFYFRTPEKMLL